jgi:hypothetical protein
VLQGSTVTLTAHLTPVLPSIAPLGGRTVTLSIGTGGTPNTCPGVTDASGTATCTVVVTATPGDATTSATFTGDVTATGSTATGATIVYAFAPGGGAFVVGDKTASGKVTFWGAQWAKANALSRASAPKDFKGFAGTVTPPTQCGATWTTRPGNSTPPPDGPLPKYMAVVVASSIAKSGPSIAGDVKKIVIVQTDGGYASDPGHAGTGVVVGTPICATP